MANMIRLSGIQRGDWPDVIKMQLHGEFRDYVPERTCHDETKPRDFFTCSECHTPIGKWVPVYCPKCGAKVVSE